MKPPALDPPQLARARRGLPDWTVDGERLHRSFVFPDFRIAFAFMTAVALAAESADHHPDWSNRWRQVDVWLVTHATGAITARDVALAREIDRLAAGFGIPAAAAAPAKRSRRATPRNPR